MAIKAAAASLLCGSGGLYEFPGRCQLLLVLGLEWASCHGALLLSSGGLLLREFYFFILAAVLLTFQLIYSKRRRLHDTTLH